MERQPGYRCNICNNWGHNVRECPTVGASNPKMTPYLGEKRCLGLFACGVCGIKWTSGNSYANVSQPCLRCGHHVFPFHQRSTASLIRAITHAETQRCHVCITSGGQYCCIHGNPPAGPRPPHSGPA